jgi:hypothetical protein
MRFILVQAINAAFFLTLAPVGQIALLAYVFTLQALSWVDYLCGALIPMYAIGKIAWVYWL